jgi:hypothetical protein
MDCANGEQKTPKGETGIFYICNLDGNVCRFAKWCTKLNKFEVATDKNGGRCNKFYPTTLSLME